MPSSEIKANLKYLFTAVSPIRSTLMSMLCPRDIKALNIATGCTPTDEERRQYLSPWRSIFTNRRWIDTLGAKGFIITMVGPDLSDTVEHSHSHSVAPLQGPHRYLLPSTKEWPKEILILVHIPQDVPNLKDAERTTIDSFRKWMGEMDDEYAPIITDYSDPPGEPDDEEVKYTSDSHSVEMVISNADVPCALYVDNGSKRCKLEYINLSVKDDKFKTALEITPNKHKFDNYNYIVVGKYWYDLRRN